MSANEHATQRQLPFRTWSQFRFPAAVKVGRISSSDITFVCERGHKNRRCRARIGHAGLDLFPSPDNLTVDGWLHPHTGKRNVVSSAGLGGSLQTAVRFFSGSSYGGKSSLPCSRTSVREGSIPSGPRYRVWPATAVTSAVSSPPGWSI